MNNQDALIEKAKALLSESDTGTENCRIYGNGFIDGIKFVLGHSQTSCEHPYHSIIGDDGIGPVKCLKCNKIL